MMNSTVANVLRCSKEYSILLLYVIFSIQGVAFFRFGNAALKPYHLLVLVWVIYTASDVIGQKRRISLLGWPFYFYFATVVLLSVINYFYVGLNTMLANYIFVFFLFIVVSLAYRNFSYPEILSQLRGAAWVIGLLILLDVVLSYGGGWAGRIDLVFEVYGGGINLEASWVALAGCFFIGKRREFIAYLMIPIIINYVTLSRTGSIITAIVFLCWIWTNRKYVKKWHVTLFAGLSIIYLVYIYFGGVLGRPLFDRFLQIGSAGGGSGREILLHYASLVLWERPYVGWGAGNAILALRSQGFSGSEDNVHNYLLQNYLDFGVFGLFFWLLFFIYMIKKSANKPELRCYLICFGVAGLVQFRGAEPLFYLVVPALISAAERCGAMDQYVKNSKI